MDAFFDTVRPLALDGKLVVVIGKAPVIAGYDRRCREKALSYPMLDCPLSSAPLPAAIAKLNARIGVFADHTRNVRYFDVAPYLCPTAVCSAFDASGKPV